MDEAPGRYNQVGILLVLAGGILFSSKAIFIKLAYAYEVSSISLLGLRMLFSLPLFLVIGYSRRRRASSEEALRGGYVAIIAALGLCGYYVASYTDFLGLRYLSAGMERVILFVYPTLVLLIMRVSFGTRIRRIQLIATAVCYLGIAVAFSASDLRTGSNFWLGAGLVFASALAYAGFVVGNGRLAPRFGSVRFTSIAMTTAALGVLAHVYLSGSPLLGLELPVYAYGLTLALVCTVLPTYMVSEGIRRIGAGDAAILGAVSPTSTIVLEYVVLGEHINATQGLGACLVVAGVVIIGRSRSG